jgi:hypothetical protein
VTITVENKNRRLISFMLTTRELSVFVMMVAAFYLVGMMWYSGSTLQNFRLNEYYRTFFFALYEFLFSIFVLATIWTFIPLKWRGYGTDVAGYLEMLVIYFLCFEAINYIALVKYKEGVDFFGFIPAFMITPIADVAWYVFVALVVINLILWGLRRG